MNNKLVESQYISLPSDDPVLGDILVDASRWSRDTKRIISRYRAAVVCETLVILALAIVMFNWHRSYGSSGGSCSQIVYCKSSYPCALTREANHLAAPAQHSLEYHPVVFTNGFGNMTTRYQGEPSDAIDKAWLDLYDGAIPRLWFIESVILNTPY